MNLKMCSVVIFVAFTAACSSKLPPATLPVVATVATPIPEKHYPLIIAAIIRVESGGNPHAVSRRGAKGLMQLMPRICRRFNVKRPFDPAENVDAGTRLFQEEMDRFNGDLKLAVAAYNAGSPRVARAIRLARTTNFVRVNHFLPRETKRYVPRVFEAFNQLKSQGVYAFNLADRGMFGGQPT